MAQLAVSLAGPAIASAVGASGFGAALLASAVGVGLNLLTGGGRGGNDSVVGPRLSELALQSSSYGQTIPLIYGKARVAGNIIWGPPIKELSRIERTRSGKGGSTSTRTTYSYTASLAIAICAGEIDQVLRVWADSNIVPQSSLGVEGTDFNVYLGTETQMPDPIIESIEGRGNVPAHRGLAYVVVRDFSLGDYGNRIPNFTFEVLRTDRKTASVESKIKEVVMIPGSGEYVYDTDIVSYKDGQLQEKHTVNANTYNGISDVRVSVDQMQKTLPNVKKVLLVVAVFSNNLTLGEVIPKVEEHSNDRVFTSAWISVHFNRDNAQTVRRRPDGTLNYGGTPSDRSIFNLAKELHSRNIEVVFYPFIQIDTLEKEWRGQMVPTSTAQLDAWFTGVRGYNNVITYYARLAFDGVNFHSFLSKFIIGSEMEGITTYSPSVGQFPGVQHFIALARSVKAILGSSTQVGYAANWSEYHSTNAWFHMDPLWTDASIDFIAIDYYMPITPDLQQSEITEAVITRYFEEGEGWDYFFNADRTIRTNYSPQGGGSPFAWKNIEGWWKAAAHTNPDGSNHWTSKAKPLLFTEFGFASVDGTTNEPNVFVDTTSTNSAYPRGSQRSVDIRAQRQGINAFIDYWDAKNAEAGNSNLATEKYLWTWDARPYPFFPTLTDVWSDHGNWETGHWIQGKLGSETSLQPVLSDLLSKQGFLESEVEFENIDDLVSGVVHRNEATLRSWLGELATLYFFDMIESNGKLKFVKKGRVTPIAVSENDLLLSNNNTSVQITREQEIDLPQEVTLVYSSVADDFLSNIQRSQRQTTRSTHRTSLTTNAILRDQDAKNICDSFLYSAWSERDSYQFSTTKKLLHLEPSDIVSLTVDGVVHTIRIVETSLTPNGVVAFSGVSEDTTVYDFYTTPGRAIPKLQRGFLIPETVITFLDIPLLPTQSADSDGFLYIAYSSTNNSQWQSAILYRSNDGGEDGGNTWDELEIKNDLSTTGSLITPLPLVEQSHLWDTENSCIVAMNNGTLESVSELAVLNGANSCVIDNEVLQFKDATAMGAGRYRLSTFLRGRLGTENDARIAHRAGAGFTVLDGLLSRINARPQSIGNLRYYKAVTTGTLLASTDETSYTYTANALKPYSPVITKVEFNTAANQIRIEWIRRTRHGGEILNGTGVTPLNEEREMYEAELVGVSGMVTTSNSFAVFTGDFSMLERIELKVYQLSQTVGRGKEASVIRSNPFKV